jgi:hypothetical protein
MSDLTMLALQNLRDCSLEELVARLTDAHEIAFTIARHIRRFLLEMQAPHATAAALDALMCVTFAHASVLLEISPATVERLVATNQLEGVHITSACPRIRVRSIQRYLDSRAYGARLVDATPPQPNGQPRKPPKRRERPTLLADAADPDVPGVEQWSDE